MNYQEFLRTKHRSIISSGFEINESELNPMLKDFQKFTIKRALKAGKYAIFADTGQGKTPMQLEIANKVSNYTGKPSLVLAPLAVTSQTIEQGTKFGIKCGRYLDTIERIILLYSNEGETIFSPFGGIGSEGYQALRMGRKSISIELKESYFELNKRNHNAAAEEKGQLKMF